MPVVASIFPLKPGVYNMTSAADNTQGFEPQGFGKLPFLDL